MTFLDVVDIQLERSDYQAPSPVYSPPFRPMLRSPTEEDRAKSGEHHTNSPSLTFQPHRKVLSEKIILQQITFVFKTERRASFDLSAQPSLTYGYGGSVSPPSLDTLYGPPPPPSPAEDSFLSDGYPVVRDLDTLTAPAPCHYDCQLLLSLIPSPLYRYHVTQQRPQPQPSPPDLTRLCQVKKILLLNYLSSQQAFNTLLL